MNGDKFVTRHEVNLGAPSDGGTGNYDPDNPTRSRRPGSRRPDVKNDRTREFIVGVRPRTDGEPWRGRQLHLERKYDQFTWNDTLNFTSANLDADVHAVRGVLPGQARGARRSRSTSRPSRSPAPFVYTNSSGSVSRLQRRRVPLNKRYSNRWMAIVSFAYNNAKDHWDSSGRYEDPTYTGIDSQHDVPGARLRAGIRAAAASTTSSTTPSGCSRRRGCTRCPGTSTSPASINRARAIRSRRRSVSPRAPNRGGTGRRAARSARRHALQNLHYADFKVEKAFTFGHERIIPSMDIFNIGNVNTVLARRRLQAATNANQISGIVAPRVLRFGVRINWYTSAIRLSPDRRTRNGRAGTKPGRFSFGRGLRFARFEA